MTGPRKTHDEHFRKRRRAGASMVMDGGMDGGGRRRRQWRAKILPAAARWQIG